MSKEKKEMIAVPVENFFSGLKTDVNVFIQLSKDKYVCVTKAGEMMDLTQMGRYQSKKLTHLYIPSVEYSTFLKKQLSIAGLVISNDKVPPKRKTDVISSISETVYRSIQKLGLDEESFGEAKALSQHVIKVVECDIHLSKIFESLQKCSESVLKHSISVSFIAPMIAKHMKWSRSETLEKLSLGGLLHDIGEKERAPESISKKRADMSYDEIRDFESHAYRGMLILASLKNIPEDIVAMVYEHHENSMGQGFPRRLWDQKIHPMARVVALTNAFCELTLDSPTNDTPLTPTQAVYHIEKIMGQPFNKECFNALKDLVTNSLVTEDNIDQKIKDDKNKKAS